MVAMIGNFHTGTESILAEIKTSQLYSTVVVSFFANAGSVTSVESKAIRRGSSVTIRARLTARNSAMATLRWVFMLRAMYFKQ